MFTQVLELIITIVLGLPSLLNVLFMELELFGQGVPLTVHADSDNEVILLHSHFVIGQNRLIRNNESS